MREDLLAARLRLTPAERAVRSRAACERLVALDPFREARTVAAYAALGAEADPAAIVRAALAARKRLVFPRLVPGARSLELAACDPADLVPGERGTRQPPPSAPAVPLDEVDCVVVPGVAFDGAGRRLGRGGGYYDATLAALPRSTARLALAFDLQLVAEVPGEPHDRTVDAVATEARVVWASGSR